MSKHVNLSKVPPEFPSSLEEILCESGELKIHSAANLAGRFNRYNVKGDDSKLAKLAVFEEIFCEKIVNKTIQNLDEFIYPALQVKTASRKVPYKYSYELYHESKTSPHTAKFLIRDADKISDPEFHKLCDDLGIITLANSASLRKFVIQSSGEELRLGTGLPYCQVICYQHSDYIGLHSDWLPRIKGGENFLVCNLCLTNEFVQEQLFIYEKDSYLERFSLSVNQGCITLLRPPFWHMTTPLQGIKGQEQRARRWLITVCFQLR